MLIYFEPFVSGPDSPLTSLGALGYKTRLVQSVGSGPPVVQAGPAQPFKDPVTSIVTVNVSNFVPVGLRLRALH